MESVSRLQELPTSIPIPRVPLELTFVYTTSSLFSPANDRIYFTLLELSTILTPKQDSHLSPRH